MKTFLLVLLLFPFFPGHAASVNGFDLNFYGFIKASTLYSSESLASFNNINLSAPTHAPAQTRERDQTSRMSFQTQQSRLGVTLEKANIFSRLEFDFIDFSKSSPTTQMNPRVRIASVTYKLQDSTFIFGQDWDLFSPVSSYTFDIVGLFFMAGNTGFMRQQFQYLYHPGDWEMGVAVGMAGNNPGPEDRELELSRSPSYSARITRKLPGGRVGLSGIYSHLSYILTDGSGHDAYGANLFYEQSLKDVALKSEFYYGQNLANIGTLAIGRGTATSDVKEFGGTLTAQLRINQNNYLFGGVGFARVDNKSEISPFSLSSDNVITSPGVRRNFLSRIGWEYRISPDFSWISELSRYDTHSKISDDSYQLNVVGGVESGVQLRF